MEEIWEVFYIRVFSVYTKNMVKNSDLMLKLRVLIGTRRSRVLEGSVLIAPPNSFMLSNYDQITGNVQEHSINDS